MSKGEGEVALPPHPSSQAEEEEKYILENLVHMNRCFKAMETKPEKMTPKAEEEFFKLKSELDSLAKCIEARGSRSELKEEVKPLSLGAIPKRVKKPTPSISQESRECKDSSSESDVSCSGSDSTSVSDTTLPTDSSVGSGCRKRNRPKKRMKKSKKDEFTLMLEAMSKLDMRQIPKFEAFDEESGVNLKYYLDSFEVYCKQNFKGANRFWIGELEALLSGSTLRAFRSVRSVDDSWASLKKKLIKWYNYEKESRQNKHRIKFQSVQYESDESIFLFATKLERMFRVAFPKKMVSYSKTLREKFISVLPVQYASMINNQLIGKKMAGKRVKWEDVKKLASMCDSEKGSHQAKCEEILINVGTQRVGMSEVGNSYCDGKNEAVDNGVKIVPQGLQEGGVPCTFMAARDENARMGGIGRLQQRFVKPNMVCHFCGRVGHAQAECRVKSGACFGCGAFDHFARECSNLRGKHRQLSSPFAGQDRRDNEGGRNDATSGRVLREGALASNQYGRSFNDRGAQSSHYGGIQGARSRGGPRWMRPEEEQSCAGHAAGDGERHREQHQSGSGN